MAQVALTQQALEDLARLVDFLEEADPGGAPGLGEAIVQALEMLKLHPLLGRRIAGRLRELVISKGRAGYLATYWFHPASDRIQVLRIRHQREAGYLD